MPDNNNTTTNTSSNSEMNKGKTTEPITTNKVEPEKSSSKKTIHNKKHKKKSLKPNQQFIWFTSIIVLIISASGFYLWDFINSSNLSNSRYTTNTKIEMSSLSGDIQSTETKLQTQINSLSKLQTELSISVQSLLSRSAHMRKDWLVSEAEYLVKLAMNRLELEGDINTAITALTNADARLLEAGDPGLLLLRQEISNNLILLKTIPIVDTSGISIQLSSVVERIDQLPLETPDPKTVELQQQQNTNDDTTVVSWKQLTSKVITDLTSLIRIRKHDRLVAPLLAPEMRFYLTQNLKLQLEQARTALLHNQQITFQERLTTSITWIQTYFDEKNYITKSAITILAKLNAINLVQDTPDLSYALKMFRDFRAGIRLTKKPAPVIKQNSTEVSPPKVIPATPTIDSQPGISL